MMILYQRSVAFERAKRWNSFNLSHGTLVRVYLRPPGRNRFPVQHRCTDREIMESVIYGIQNTTNSKWYVGQSTNERNRKSEHFADLRHGIHYNTHLQAAYNKYGRERFTWIILERVNTDEADGREIYWIHHLRSIEEAFGYNKESGGRALKKLSPESKAKMSKSRMGRIVSAETRKKISESNMGKTHTAEARQKLRIANLGRKDSKEICAKRSKSNIGRTHSEGARAKIGAAHFGKYVSPEARAQISARLKGRRLTDEWKRKISIGLTGIKRTPEEIAKRVATMKGRIRSPEHCAKISAFHKGRKASPETRAKMSASHKRRLANKASTIQDGDLQSCLNL